MNALEKQIFLKHKKLILCLVFGISQKKNDTANTAPPFAMKELAEVLVNGKEEINMDEWKILFGIPLCILTIANVIIRYIWRK